MKEYRKIEVTVGLFVVVGILALAYLSISLAGLQMLRDTYSIEARFSNVGSLQPGAPVKLAGVPVGTVESVELEDYTAHTVLSIEEGLELPTDTMASIEVAGIMGKPHVSLSPGAARETLSEGGQINRTEPAVNVTDLIGKYAFGSPTESGPSDGGAEKDSSLLGDPLQ